MAWNCHVDESAKVIYDMILGRYILKSLGLSLLLSDHVIESYGGPLKGYTSPMVDLGRYEFKILNTGNITPQESFMNPFS